MNRAFVLIAFMLTFLLVLFIGPGGQARAQGAQHEPVDIVLVIDDSGSMSNNDSDGLRYAAARLLVELAGEGDRVGIVQFGTTATTLGAGTACLVSKTVDIDVVDIRQCPLVEIEAAGRDAFIRQIQLPTHLRGNTCMHFGLGLAQRMLDAARSAGRPQAILFLTDGNFMCPEGDPSSQRDLDNIIARLAQTDIVTYPIILGDDVSDDVPERLVRATGGRVHKAADADELLPAFSEVYATLQPSRYAATLDLDPGSRSTTMVTTPEQKVTEINFVVARGSFNGLRRGTTSLDPGNMDDGGTFTMRADQNSVGGAQYEILTLRGNPLVGTWQLNLGQGANHALAVVDARVAPTLDFPRSEQIFAARHVSRRNDGYLLFPAAVSDGQPLNVDVIAPGETVDNGPVNFRRVSDAGGPFEFTVQVGDQVAPLVLRRTFDVRPGDFPRVEIVELNAGAAGIPARFVARWATEAGAVLSDTFMEVLVIDQSRSIIYRSTDFSCEGNVCSHEGFVQDPGRTYDVWLLASATTPEGIYFSDYANSRLSSEPQLQIRNLPDTIDLIENAGPFDIEVLVQSEVDPGSLAVTLVDADGRPFAAQPRLTLETGLIPGGKVNGRLVFNDLAAFPVSGFNGELRFSNDNVRVVPEKRTVTYRPRIELSLDETINLTSGMGPYEITARLVGNGAPTVIQAQVVDTTTGDESPIIAVLNMPQLQPGATTIGYISFSMTPGLSADHYSARVIFSAADGTPVEPGATAVEILLIPANVKLGADSQLNFGDWLNPTQPITLPVTLDFSNLPPVTISAVVDAPSSPVPLSPNLRPGEISLSLATSSERMPTGEITGFIEFEVADAIGGEIQPSRIPFRVNRPGYWAIFFWCDPTRPVSTAQPIQRVGCWFVPWRTILEGTGVSYTRWHLLSILRLIFSGAISFILFVAWRARSGTDNPQTDGEFIQESDEPPDNKWVSSSSGGWGSSSSGGSWDSSSSGGWGSSSPGGRGSSSSGGSWDSSSSGGWGSSSSGGGWDSSQSSSWGESGSW